MVASPFPGTRRMAVDDRSSGRVWAPLARSAASAICSGERTTPTGPAALDRGDRSAPRPPDLTPRAQLTSGDGWFGLGEEVFEVEVIKDRAQAAALVVGPLFDWPVPGEFEIVAVGIGEIDRFVGTVVRKLPERHARSLETPDRVCEAGARRVVERDVV